MSMEVDNSDLPPEAQPIKSQDSGETSTESTDDADIGEKLTSTSDNLEKNDTEEQAPVKEELKKSPEHKSVDEPAEDNSKPDKSDETEEKPENEIVKKSDDTEESKPEELPIQKDNALIQAAQDEIKSLDLFVCGKCHHVSHFLEEFQEHKSGLCSKTQVCSDNPPAKIWAFCLWKAKQTKDEPSDKPRSSWNIYETWCKMPASEREVWQKAGEELKNATNFANAKICESRTVEKDPLSLDDDSQGVIKKENDVVVVGKNGDTNRAFKIVKESIKQECTVEKIVQKRFNPRRKTFEYQVKWANYDSSENTWEPPTNLERCKTMLEEFEEMWKKQKAEQKLNGTPKGRGRPRLSASTPKQYVAAVSPANMIQSTDSAGGRPQRASKQKALNQVKSWCGNISDTDEGNGKRPYDDDDSDDSFEKKMKLEDYSDSDDEKPKYFRKTPKTTTTTTTATIVNNGAGGKLPHNVFIPDANGVVRINQKQLPSLSTGVYIMSKTAGIIKLDSTTSKVATSGGQTIVKVGPKIGQTQVKVIKQEGPSATSKLVQNSPKVPTKTYKPVITKIKRAEPDKSRVASKAKDDLKSLMSQPTDDDSDDGIPELEFPTDLPLPEPESPPGDFVLDPETGKIAGKEYPEHEEKPVVVSEIPSKTSIETSSLENIVKLAAADITEEDLKTDTPIINQLATPVTLVDTVPMSKADQVGSIQATIVETESDNSILNKALTNSNILQKTLVSRPKPQIQNRILNHSIGQQRTPQMMRNSPMAMRQNQAHMARTKQIPPQPKYNISSTVKVGNASARNVYSKNTTLGDNTPRSKVEQHTVYRNVGGMMSRQQQQSSRLAQSAANMNVYKTSVRKEVPAQTSRPKAVISMPSLIGDDEPTAAVQSTSAAALATISQPPAPTPSTSAAAKAPAASNETDLSALTLEEGEGPMFITGDDGTVYQIAGRNEEGQTILITQGSDGQQQCLLVTNDITEEDAAASADEEAAMELEEAPKVVPQQETEVTDPLSVKTEEESAEADAGDSAVQVVAQLVRALPPSPGGTHKVVVMLPDGNLVETEVSPEEYASLELE